MSRSRPRELALPASVEVHWIEADMTSPLDAAKKIEREAPPELDVLIYNLGVWEERAFEDEYEFLGDADNSIIEMVGSNVTGTILLLKRMIPRLLGAPRPLLILVGSTSGLRQSGRPEVTFGASKFALTGVADALRENFREQRLAVTCLQPGYLNTEDLLSVPKEAAAARGDGKLVPVHDVVSIVKTLLNLSDASYVRELVIPAILDGRF